MNLEKLGHYTQIVSAAFLIVGVVLVVLQLRQTEALTRAQLMNEGWAMRIQQAGAAAGEQPMESMAKLCAKDTRITHEDVLIVHHFLLQRVFLIMRAKYVNQAAGFDDELWKQEAIGNLGVVLASEHGQAWVRGFNFPAWFMDLVDEYEATRDLSCGSRHPAIEALIQVDLAKGGRRTPTDAAH